MIQLFTTINKIHQCTYTPIHIITTFTKFHQCTNSPSHIFNYEMTRQIISACNVPDSSRCMWYQRIPEKILPYESTNIINTTNYVLQKLCNKHHELHSSNHLNMTMNAWTSSKESTIHNLPT